MTYTLRDENGLRVANPDNNYDYNPTDLLELLEELGFTNQSFGCLRHKLDQDFLVSLERVDYLTIRYKDHKKELTLVHPQRTDEMVSVVLSSIRSTYKIGNK